jgi:hypothetical protein
MSTARAGCLVLVCELKERIPFGQSNNFISPFKSYPFSVYFDLCEVESKLFILTLTFLIYFCLHFIYKEKSLDKGSAYLNSSFFDKLKPQRWILLLFSILTCWNFNTFCFLCELNKTFWEGLLPELKKWKALSSLWSFNTRFVPRMRFYIFCLMVNFYWCSEDWIIWSYNPFKSLSIYELTDPPTRPIISLPVNPILTVFLFTCHTSNSATWIKTTPRN